MRSLLFALVALAALPASAGAASVAVLEGDDEVVFGMVLVDGDAGPDDLLVTERDGLLTVRDRTGARLGASRRCRRLARHAVRCDVREILDLLSVTGGGGDDRLDVQVSRRYVSGLVAGGPGDDRVRVRRGGATLTGGPGRDVLRGGPLGDELLGGRGADRLHGGRGNDGLGGDIHVREDEIEGAALRAGVSADVLHGGPGRDMARYDERPRGGLVVDLARGRGGEDRLRSVESVAGTGGRDVLRGNARGNRLLGGAGRDVLDGRGGDDRLDVGAATPSNTGGGDRALDRVACGPGRDVVADATESEILPRDCERLFLEYELETPFVQLLPAGPHRVRTQAACVSTSLDCTRRITLRHRGRIIGESETVRLTRPLTWVTVALRRPLPRTGIVSVALRGFDVEEGDFDDGPLRTPYHLTLRLRR